MADPNKCSCIESRKANAKAKGVKFLICKLVPGDMQIRPKSLTNIVGLKPSRLGHSVLRKTNKNFASASSACSDNYKKEDLQYALVIPDGQVGTRELHVI